MEMESHGSVSIMKRQSQHKTTGQSLWREPLSARSELDSHPSSGLRAPHKGRRAGGPDGTYHDRWRLQLGKTTAFLARHPCPGGHANLLCIVQRKREREKKNSNCACPPYTFSSHVALDDVTVFEAAELDALALLANTWDNELDPEVSAQLVQASAPAYLSFGKEKGKGKGKANGKGKGRYPVRRSHLSLADRRRRLNVVPVVERDIGQMIANVQ